MLSVQREGRVRVKRDEFLEGSLIVRILDLLPGARLVGARLCGRRRGRYRKRRDTHGGNRLRWRIALLGSAQFCELRPREVGIKARLVRVQKDFPRFSGSNRRDEFVVSLYVG